MGEPRREPKTEAEAQDLKKYLERGAKTTVGVEKDFQAPQPVTVQFGKPTPVAIGVPTQQAIQELGDEEEKQAFVEIEFGGEITAQDYSVLVFLNNDKATEQTTADDPSYLGAIAFFCHGETRDGSFVCMLEPGETLKYRFNATKALRKTAASPVASPSPPQTTTRVTRPTTIVRPADTNLKINLVTVPFPDRKPLGRALQVTAAKLELLRSTIETS